MPSTTEATMNAAKELRHMWLHDDEKPSELEEKTAQIIQRAIDDAIAPYKAKVAVLDSIMANVPDNLILGSNGSFLLERGLNSVEACDTPWVLRTVKTLAVVLLNARQALAPATKGKE